MPETGLCRDRRTGRGEQWQVTERVGGYHGGPHRVNGLGITGLVGRLVDQDVSPCSAARVSAAASRFWGMPSNDSDTVLDG